MFKPIRPFENNINKYQTRITTGTTVPQNAVNLSYFYSPKLSPEENIILSLDGNYCYANASQPQEIIAYACEDYKLRVNEKGDWIDAPINSDFIEITDKFYDNIPLYYGYKLKYLHYDKIDTDDYKEHEYNELNIKLTDLNGYELPNNYLYKIYIRRTKCNSEDLRMIDKYKYLYEVTIYTNFEITNNFNIIVRYNAVSSDDTTYSINLLPNYKEYINPQSYYNKATSLSEMINEENMYYIKRNDEKLKFSDVYVNGCFKDTRNPIRLTISGTVIFEEILGEYTSPIFNFNLENIELYNRNSAITEELEWFDNNKQILYGGTVKELISNVVQDKNIIKRDIISVQLKIDKASHSGDTVFLHTKPDGTGYIYGETSADTGHISMEKNRLYKVVNEYVRVGYAIKFKDRQPINLEIPRESDSLESWFIRIKIGYFTKESHYNKIHHYYIPEYYRQHFDEKLGAPYKRIYREKVQILNQHDILLKNTPLYKDIKIYKLDAKNNKWYLNIVNYGKSTGIVTLNEYISLTDSIYADYVFEEYCYVYKGNSTIEKGKTIFSALDVCPNRHHYFNTNMEETGFKEVPTFQLVNQIMYIYIKPAIIEDTEHNTFEMYNNVVFHMRAPFSELECEIYGYVLIGKIFVRANSSFYSLKTIDTRTRGGGISDTLSDDLRKELEPDSNYYWDIGYWDGEAYPENSVIVIRIDRRLLKQFGGTFTEQEVEQKIYKHVAAGTYCLIEYVIPQSQLTINNLDINIEQLNKLDFTPIIWTKTKSDYTPSIISLEKNIYEVETPHLISIVN